MEQKNLFTKGRIASTYFQLSLPLVFSLTVTLIYNLADTFFVAQTNDTNIVTGVSLGAPVFTLLMAFGNIFGQGGASLLSRYLGEQQPEKVKKISSFCFYISILMGLATTVVMLLAREPMIWLLGADDASFPHALSYYTWLAIGAPALVLSFVPLNLLRSEGLSKEAMIGVILGAVVNIVLDPLFISTLGLGAGGAAIATIIGYFCTDIYYIFVVARKSRILSMDPRLALLAWHDIEQILRIGIPAALSNVTQSISVILMNQLLLPYGNEKIAAMGIALKVSMIVMLFLTGFAFGGAPLYGYYYGAGDRKRLVKLLRFNLRFLVILAIALTAVVFLAAPALMRVFIDNDAIVADGTVMLRWQVITMVLTGIILLMTIICQSFGKAAGALVLSISRQGVILFVVMLIARAVAGYQGVIAAQAISDIITAVIALVLFHKTLRREFLPQPEAAPQRHANVSRRMLA